MREGSEIIVKKPSAAVARRNAALLEDQPKSKDLTPKVDLPALRKGNPWRHVLPFESFGYLPMAGGFAGAITLFNSGALPLAILVGMVGASGYWIPRMGRIMTGSDDIWAKQASEAHLRRWLMDQWGIEAGPDAFKEKDLTKFVNKGAVEKYKFAAVDGKTYKLSRLAKGGSVVLTDGFNKEVARTRTALLASAAKIPVSQFNAEGQVVANRIQELMAQLSRTELSIEQQHVVERSGKMLVEASDLAERISGLSGDTRAQVDGQLATTLRSALSDLEQIVSDQAQAAVSEAQVLATFAQEVSLKKPASRLQLPPES